MKAEWVERLEQFLEGNDFGKNWDGAYQDAVPTLTRYFQAEGFLTRIASEWESESRETELIAVKETLIVRIPWAQDYQGRSIVDLTTLVIQQQRRHAAE